jgi:hypothetical protein
MRRVLIVLGVLSLAISFVGGASGSSNATGWIAGKVYVCGGGMRPTGCTPADDRARVSVFNSNHRAIASEQVKDGHFSFRLPPGPYNLRAHWTGLHAHKTAVASAHHTTYVRFRFYLH